MLTTENVDKHIITVGNDLLQAQAKIIETPNIPVKELREMLKVQSENIGVLQWLQEVKKSIQEQNAKQCKIVSQ
jgi:hypothetical protein